MYVSNAIAHAVVSSARWHGVEPAALHDHSGIDSARLVDPTGMMPLTMFETLTRSALALSRVPGLGLHVGAAAPVGMLHVIGHLLASCRSLREAFAAFQQFAPLIDRDGQYELLDGRETGLFRFRPGHGSPAFLRFRAELCIGFTVRLCRQLLAVARTAEEVRFAHPAPDYAAEYESLLGCRVSFGHPHNDIVFPRDVLDARLVGADGELLEAMRARAEKLLSRQEQTEDLVQIVRRMLHDAPQLDGLDAERIARRLRMSPRTLRRRLSEHEHSFSALLDDARRQRALAALARHDVCVKSLAEELGFSEPSALHRAFKRWTGTTVGAYRRPPAADGP